MLEVLVLLASHTNPSPLQTHTLVLCCAAKIVSFAVNPLKTMWSKQ